MSLFDCCLMFVVRSLIAVRCVLLRVVWLFCGLRCAMSVVRSCVWLCAACCCWLVMSVGCCLLFDVRGCRWLVDACYCVLMFLVCCVLLCEG